MVSFVSYADRVFMALVLWKRGRDLSGTRAHSQVPSVTALSLA